MSCEGVLSFFCSSVREHQSGITLRHVPSIHVKLTQTSAGSSAKGDSTSVRSREAYPRRRFLITNPSWHVSKMDQDSRYTHIFASTSAPPGIRAVLTVIVHHEISMLYIQSRDEENATFAPTLDIQHDISWHRITVRPFSHIVETEDCLTHRATY